MTVEMTAWQLLLCIGGVLMAAEIFVPGFVLMPIGLGFVATAAAAFFVKDWAWLLLILAGMEGLMFFVFKRLLKNQQERTNAYTNVEGMIGKEVEVVADIPEVGTGYVKLYGDQWLAQSQNRARFEKGSRVVIVAVEGNKVIIEGIN